MKIINLLPKPKQQELYYENLFHAVAVAGGIAIAMLVAIFVMQLGLRFYLTYEAKSMEKETERTRQLTNKEENNELKQKIRLINAQMNDFKNLAETTPAWSKVLLAFADQVPEGVQINSFSADLTTKKITISGFAPTREQVIQLYNNINDDKNRFKDINYPLENVSKPANINFHFTFYIKDELLKL